VEFLISKGADPDANKCGATALHRAAYAGSYESCEMLLKAGANPNAIDSSFRDHGTPLHKAASAGHEKILDLLLSFGADASIVDASGHTFAQCVISKKRQDAINEAPDDFNEARSPPRNDDYVEGATKNNLAPIREAHDATQDPNAMITSGMKCAKCQEICLSFTRLSTGELICSSCKYKEQY
jgi:hypothetical protein